MIYGNIHNLRIVGLSSFSLSRADVPEKPDKPDKPENAGNEEPERAYERDHDDEPAFPPHSDPCPID
jgi:hypothetical protein